MIREKELRLALVCYGGISLAVYMHGISKEVWRLARASCSFHEGRIPAGGSQGVYRALLQEIEDEHHLRLRVLIDIIAGASAGGINGVFLAQAIATGQSLEPLTRLWFDSADVEQLIDPNQGPAHRLAKIWALPLVWFAQRRSGDSLDKLVEPAARKEVRTKLSKFVRSRWFEPPFGGKRFLNLVIDAFEAMAAAPRGPRLLPDGQPLDLFVTVTDFTGHPERLTLNSPPEVIETEHRLIFPFSDCGTARDSLAPIGELAFAARATSSFPGAFPPVTVGELDAVLAERGLDWPEREAFLAKMLPRHAAVGAADKAVLIDGSVLVNAPFRPAIEALRQRPARRQVDRRFIYIDPYPGGKLDAAKRGIPGFFQTIIGAVSALPRQQPIRDNLEAITERSERAQRMAEIIAGIRPEVEAEVEALFGYTLFLDRPNVARLASWRKRAQTAAATKAGYGYAAYGHLKLAGVIDAITQLLHDVSGDPGVEHRAELHRLVTRAVKALGMNAVGPTFAGGTSPTTIAFLRSFDVGFRIRRLRLLARRLSDIEAQYDEVDIGALREAIYASLARYLDAKRTDQHLALASHVERARGDAVALLDALAASLDLKTLDNDTEARLTAALCSVNREVRRTMLLTYLGFPYFDVATLPLLQGEGLDEFDAIKVDRISPDDATAIRAGGAEATLKGIQFSSFGAFFSRTYRENDYLWGRLHGADRLIDIIVSTLPSDMPLARLRISALKRQAFIAILDEEEPLLTNIQPLIASLRREIG
ncbi:MAG: patatin-like protein [Sphingomonas sp.]|uniref:patatin-like protein n=1 Tax=Sphingomonas sp. TaxID=28214 RepID=UPI001849A161|nr:patatin-like protein [Sphingomonas sp.]